MIGAATLRAVDAFGELWCVIVIGYVWFDVVMVMVMAVVCVCVG
jgi:hypothetical protein